MLWYCALHGLIKTDATLCSVFVDYVLRLLFTSCFYFI